MIVVPGDEIAVSNWRCAGVWAVKPVSGAAEHGLCSKNLPFQYSVHPFNYRSSECSVTNHCMSQNPFHNQGLFWCIRCRVLILGPMPRMLGLGPMPKPCSAGPSTQRRRSAAPGTHTSTLTPTLRLPHACCASPRCRPGLRTLARPRPGTLGTTRSMQPRAAHLSPHRALPPRSGPVAPFWHLL
jgi:hypothetical protein